MPAGCMGQPSDTPLAAKTTPSVLFCLGNTTHATADMHLRHCRVEHLYQHIFPPDHAPTISFVGLPWKVVPFAQYELQSKWIARVLSGRAGLPAARDMHKHIQAFYTGLEQSNIPQRYAQAQPWGD